MSRVILTASDAEAAEGGALPPPSPAPEPGQLARVRGRIWVVADAARDTQAARDGRPVQHLVSLVSVEDDATGEELQVIWEIEPGTKIIEQAELPRIARDALDDPAELEAFLDAVRWGAVTSADQRALQAPFRSGITIEDYQLEPLVRALRMPRTTLLIADDVGLGKTIEAGLVVQELLLRHRARTALVVCPASLQVQWRDELREKFGLEFRIVDRELLGRLRRSRGVGANPFSHFPRLIVSIDWVKAELGMRLLREVLPPHPEIPRRYDILIVDEVHNCAPAGAGGRYARDTLRTAAIRTLAPHCEHRLFLSATPHNGYDNSFAALLELLDPHRFARGIRPAPQATREVVVRRLKQDLKHPDGSPRFARREIVMLEVDHPPQERAVHSDLVAYGAARARRLHGDRAQKLAADFVTTLLKKRLFSSPAAFLRTLEVHRATLKRAGQPWRPAAAVLERIFDDAELDADEERTDTGVGAATQEALEAAADAEPNEPTGRELELLDRMCTWAERAAVTEDARTTRLLDWVAGQVKPGKRFTDTRVIVFTEYRATQRYLQERLSARGIAGDRVALLDGTTDPDDRERIKAEWQEPPADYPVRVLLATDAASEGISLQRQCHLLAHAEIPWNPNRLEQRNGRVDRHGQSAEAVFVHHCVSAGWETGKRAADGTLEGDLDFLARVVRKVEQIREDLGSAAPVIATQVEEAMLGRRRTLDESRFGDSRALRSLVSQERRMGERLARLRDELEQSRQTLHLTPGRVERVVATALRLARQLPLIPGDEPGTFQVPALTGSWAPAWHGLDHPTRKGVRRPITFDHDQARGRTDVVLAHLGHRLVQLSLSLLRAEVWGTGRHLHRVAVRHADPAIGGPVAIAHGRLVITGASGHRLHEQVVAAGLRLSPGSGFDRLNVSETEAALGHSARSRGAVAGPLLDQLVPRLSAASDQLRAALQARAGERARDLTATLGRRAAEERGHVAATLSELAATIRAEAFGEGGDQLQLITGLELDAGDRRQVERDRVALRERLDAIPGEIEAEQAAIDRRYAEPTHRLFPAAVTLLVPSRGRV